MEWQIVTTIITLVSFGVAVIKPILKLNSSIVKLTDAVEHESKLDDHEKRIIILEQKE